MYIIPIPINSQNRNMLHRRSFLLGLGSVVAAPAIVRAASLMPVKPWPYVERGVLIRAGFGPLMWRVDHKGLLPLYGRSPGMTALPFFGEDFTFTTLPRPSA
jgi:hypothetical protein